VFRAVGRVELIDRQIGRFLFSAFMMLCNAAFTFGRKLVGTASSTLAIL
jgi:hypothetical protein